MKIGKEEKVLLRQEHAGRGEVTEHEHTNTGVDSVLGGRNSRNNKTQRAQFATAQISNSAGLI